MLSIISSQLPIFSHFVELSCLGWDKAKVVWLNQLPCSPGKWQKSCRKTAGASNDLLRRCHPITARLLNLYHANVTSANSAKKVAGKLLPKFTIRRWKHLMVNSGSNFLAFAEFQSAPCFATLQSCHLRREDSFQKLTDARADVHDSHCCNGRLQQTHTRLLECLNKILTYMLSMNVDIEHKTQNTILPNATFASNTAVQETTSFTFFHLIYGQVGTTTLSAIMEEVRST